jgi:hypothetical protein
MFNDSLTDSALKGGLEFIRLPSRPSASKWGFWVRMYFQYVIGGDPFLCSGMGFEGLVRARGLNAWGLELCSPL